jgi:hypothetical protein
MHAYETIPKRPLTWSDVSWPESLDQSQVSWELRTHPFDDRTHTRLLPSAECGIAAEPIRLAGRGLDKLGRRHDAIEDFSSETPKPAW